MTFGESITTCMAKYATFSGRASRSEFWWFYLFLLGFSWIASLVDSYVYENDIGLFNAISQLVFLLPQIAVGARRYHDINKSGWWQLLGLTIILLPLTIYWYAKKSDSGRNRYDTDEELSESDEDAVTEVPAPTGLVSDHLTTLEKLHEMKEKGIITEQEFLVKKEELLRQTGV